MDVLAIIGQKGGNAKTTTAECLAEAATLAGHSVLVIDFDPQASAANWRDRRVDKEKPLVITAPPGRLVATVEAARSQGIDLVY